MCHEENIIPEEVLGQADSVLYSMTLSRNTATGETTLRSVLPRGIHFVFNKYSGNVAVSISGK